MPSASKKKTPTTVDDYIAKAPPKMVPTLKALRAAIRAAAPQAEEGIRMGVPAYSHRGQLVAFAAAAKHCAFYVMSPGPISRRKQSLAHYDVALTAIRFSPDLPIPKSLVVEIVRERVQENEAKR
jgi:uncharacterized protein YdhG (YjbR/CyaY superfamily)